MAIIGKMDPTKFAQIRKEHDAKMAAIVAKRHQAEAAAAEAALAAHYAEAVRLAGSYQPFATVAKTMATELRQEFVASAKIVQTGRLRGRFASKVKAAETVAKLNELGYGQ